MPAAAECNTSSLLAALWGRKQPLMLERLALLDRAVQAASDGGLHSPLREAALAEAHNLAGSLGTFGFPEGTRIARELECGLEAETLSPAELRNLTERLRATLFPIPTADDRSTASSPPAS